MPRVSTMPQEHIWLPDRSLCRAAWGSLKGMYHVFNTLKCSSCVGASARRPFPLSVLVAEVKHSWLTRVLSCITPSSEWHVCTVFSAVCSVDWTQDPTLPSRPLCVSVRWTVYVIALIFCTHELKTGEILVLTAQIIVIQMYSDVVCAAPSCRSSLSSLWWRFSQVLQLLSILRPLFMSFQTCAWAPPYLTCTAATNSCCHDY